MTFDKSPEFTVLFLIQDFVSRNPKDKLNEFFSWISATAFQRWERTCAAANNSQNLQVFPLSDISCWFTSGSRSFRVTGKSKGAAFAANFRHCILKKFQVDSLGWKSWILASRRYHGTPKCHCDSWTNYKLTFIVSFSCRLIRNKTGGAIVLIWCKRCHGICSSWRRIWGWSKWDPICGQKIVDLSIGNVSQA